MRILIQEIVNQLLAIQEAKTWIGENFSKKLDMVDETEVFTRPLPDLHSIAEIISHLPHGGRRRYSRLRQAKVV